MLKEMEVSSSTAVVGLLLGLVLAHGDLAIGAPNFESTEKGSGETEPAPPESRSRGITPPSKMSPPYGSTSGRGSVGDDDGQEEDLGEEAGTPGRHLRRSQRP